MSDENRDVDINQGGTQTSTDSSLLSLDTAGIRVVLQVRFAVVVGSSSGLLDHITSGEIFCTTINKIKIWNNTGLSTQLVISLPTNYSLLASESSFTSILVEMELRLEDRDKLLFLSLDTAGIRVVLQVTS